MAIIDNYSPYSWKDKELITATKLNKIENTLAALAENGLSCKSDGNRNINGPLEYHFASTNNETFMIYNYGNDDNLRGVLSLNNNHNQWQLRQYPTSGGRYFECYSLPQVSNITDNSHHNYDILTSKYSGTFTRDLNFPATPVPAGNDIKTQIGTITIPSSNHTQTYILIVSCWWSTTDAISGSGANDNGNGIRKLGINTNDNGFNYDRTCVIGQPACSGMGTDQQLTTIFQVAGNSSDLTWYIYARHTSTGNTLYARAGYRLISIT